MSDCLLPSSPSPPSAGERGGVRGQGNNNPTPPTPPSPPIGMVGEGDTPTFSKTNCRDTPLCLGLEAAGPRPGVGLARGEEILWEMAEADPPSKAQALFIYLAKARDEGRLDLSRVDLISVTAGPGSFTGLKVALAAAKGLAWALNRPVRPVSSLAGLAWSMAQSYPDHLLVPILDARRGLVYTAFFRSAGGRIERLTPDRASSPDDLCDELGNRPEIDKSCPAVLAGEGLYTYGDFFQGRLGRRVHLAPAGLWPIRPGWVARLGLMEAAALGTVDPRDLQAVYLRPAEVRYPARPLIQL